MPSPPLLEMRGITKEFSGVRALTAADLEVRSGEVLGLVGENGAGKSTLMKVLGGVHPFGTFSGEVRIAGRPQRFRSAADARNAGVAVVHQELSLLPDMTVAENLLLGREPRRLGMVDSVEQVRQAKVLLDRFGGESINPEIPAGQLGVGLQQIVEIARALGDRWETDRRREPNHQGAKVAKKSRANSRLSLGGLGVLAVTLPFPSGLLGTATEAGPARRTSGDAPTEDSPEALADGRIVVLDEPTAALTDRERNSLFEVLRQLKANGTTFIYISHRMEELFTICDRITVLRDGRSVGTVDVASSVPAEIVALVVGQELAEMKIDRAVPKGAEVVLDVENLSVDHPHLRHRKVVDGLSLKVRAGEVVTLAGAMGAGRTAALSALFGTARGNVTGQVRVSGRPVRLDRPAAAVAHGIALVPEDRKGQGLVLMMSVSENLSMASLRSPVIDDVQVELAADRHARDLRIKSAGLDAPVATLSGGNQQKVVIGKWLATSPKVLLLDEPTRGVDIGAKAELYRLIQRLVDQGVAILMASSDLPEVLLLSDRILVLREGRLAGELTRAKASSGAIMQLAIGVEKAS